MAWLIFSLFLLLPPLFAGDDERAWDDANRIMAERYPDAYRQGDFYRAGIAGMAALADQVGGTQGSGVLTADEYAAVQARNRGERSGIGLQFHLISGQGLLVSRVYPGTPAANLGMEVGDLVVAINDQPFVGLSRGQMAAVLDGLQDGKLRLNVRKADGSARSLLVAKGSYKVDAVQPCELSSDDGACLQLLSFGVGASDALKQALDQLGGTRGVVLDLRDNMGGLIEEVVASASLFLEAGQVVVIRELPGGQREPLAAKSSPVWRGRLTLVVDDTTSGLAEVFVAALREQVRATVVGTHTAGLASQESYYPLSGGLVLRLVDVGLRSPTGRSWAGKGLAPDLYVEHPDPVLAITTSAGLSDLQLEAAIRLIRGP